MMMKRSADEVMDALGDDLIVEFDRIARAGHSRFMAYQAEVLVELDVRAQAACTYAHMVAEADRRFVARPGVRTLYIRGLKLWHF